MQQLEKLLALLQVPQLGAQKIGRLLSDIHFEQFCSYGKAELRQLGWNDRQIHHWQYPKNQWIDLALHWADAPNQQIITLFDEDYPFLLKQISTAPPVLFVRGKVSTLSLPQIAIVGSRDYSAYGEYWAKKLASELAQQGIVVTSGLAIGIDGFCHQAALNAEGITVAVLGSGLNRVYPHRHRRLAEQIVENGGALVSEFFPEQPPLAENFPRRNRIISGLSLGTLVVEAAINSGSLITARYALEQGREVFALPNTAQNPYSSGCHKLIKEGALLTETTQDILDAIAFQQQPMQRELFAEETAKRPVQAVQKSQNFAKNLPNLTAYQQQIMAQLSFSPIAVDDIAENSGLEIETVLVEMLNLELLGVVKQTNGGYVLMR